MTITRRSLLYESKVEYGGWTINHVQGCSHGCRYPCYAMSLAKRTGRVKTYEQWCIPQPVENALELLESELPRYRGKIGSVHLSFTTDPFMWDSTTESPSAEIASLTASIIRRINDEGIRATVLTKGVYPDEFVGQVGDLHPHNQYGISIVSLSETFRSHWEPGSAPVTERLQSLKQLSDAGAATWVSVEPFPTPNVDPSSSDPAPLLEAVSFVDKAVFGRWNYNKAVNSYPDAEHHYMEAARQFSDWAERNDKVLHIKRGTPLHESHSVDVLDLRGGGHESRPSPSRTD